MAISMNPYLNFAGNAREAMTYYQGIFGGKLDIMTFSDFHIEDMPAEGTMHAALVHDNFTIMASDAMPGAEQTWRGTRNFISLSGDDVDILKGWYQQLAAEGTAGMPLEVQIWGDMYGDVKDKYGIEWMINISLPTASPQPDETA